MAEELLDGSEIACLVEHSLASRVTCLVHPLATGRALRYDTSPPETPVLLFYRLLEGAVGTRPTTRELIVRSRV